jgi:hypothetical protein
MRKLVVSAIAALWLSSLFACKKPVAGGACSHEGEALCKDPAAILTCKDKKWEEASCRGPDGCKKTGVMVNCDETVAQEGDACGSVDGDHFSCSADKKNELKCDKGKWKVVGRCGGPNGCEAKFPFVKCDNTIANVGDLCAKDGDAACSTDAKAILECKGGKFSQTERCQGKCKVEGLFVKCN